MRISDWSSDVCSSDLFVRHADMAMAVMCAGKLATFDRAGVNIAKTGVIIASRTVNFILGATGVRLIAIMPLAPAPGFDQAIMRSVMRSEERRVGNECVSKFRSRWSQYP